MQNNKIVEEDKENIIDVKEIEEKLKSKRKSPNQGKKQLFALSKKQIDELLNIAQQVNFRYYVLILLMLKTGLRIDEALNLTIDDVNFKRKEITIRQKFDTDRHKRWKAKTKNSYRIVPVDKTILNLLKQLKSEKSDYFFFSQKTLLPLRKETVITEINKIAKKCPSIGRAIGTHTFRRTFITYLLEQNFDIALISKIAGHSKVETTWRYIHRIIKESDFELIRKKIAKI